MSNGNFNTLNMNAIYRRCAHLATLAGQIDALTKELSGLSLAHFEATQDRLHRLRLTNEAYSKVDVEIMLQSVKKEFCELLSVRIREILCSMQVKTKEVEGLLGNFVRDVAFEGGGQ